MRVLSLVLFLSLILPVYAVVPDDTPVPITLTANNGKFIVLKDGHSVTKIIHRHKHHKKEKTR